MEIEFDFSRPSDRAHVANRLISASPSELKLIALRAIDHSHKISAEMIEIRALADGALGQLAELNNEINRLRGLLNELVPNWEKLDRE